MSRAISELHPVLLPLYYAFVKECGKSGIDFIVTCTWRSNKEQNKLYAQGRTEGGKIVTLARGGESAHNVMLRGQPASCAFDIVVMKDGKPDWDVNNRGWHNAGAAGLIVGLDWAGAWTRFKEYPHFQLTDWKQYANNPSNPA